MRPPLYDSPTPAACWTPRLVYWAVDSFATPVPGGEGADNLAPDVAELDAKFWTHGMTMFAFNVLSHRGYGSSIRIASGPRWGAFPISRSRRLSRRTVPRSPAATSQRLSQACDRPSKDTGPTRP